MAEAATKLAKFMPTGTFLTFQALVPVIMGGSGTCANVAAKILTAIVLATFSLLCFLLSFTDSVKIDNVLYYYIVYPWGFNFLGGNPPPNIPGVATPVKFGSVMSPKTYVCPCFWTCCSSFKSNPEEKPSETNPKTVVVAKNSVTSADKSSPTDVHAKSPEAAIREYEIGDFFHAIFSTVVFAVLALVTPPVTTCFYPGIDDTLVRSLPLLVGMISGFFLLFLPKPRAGLGFSGDATPEFIPPSSDSQVKSGTRDLESGNPPQPVASGSGTLPEV